MEIIKPEVGFYSSVELVKVKRKDIAEISKYLNRIVVWDEDLDALVINDKAKDFIVPPGNYLYKNNDNNTIGIIHAYELESNIVEEKYNVFYKTIQHKINDLQNELFRVYKILGPKSFNKDKNKELLKKQKKYTKIVNKTIDDLYID